MELTSPSVIQSLDVDSLAAGEHKFNFAAATSALGQWQLLPVRVFKGAKPGKKVMITAGVHGDEQSGIMTALELANKLVGEELAGCVTIVPIMNPSGVLNHSRDFHPVDPDTSPSNMNRYFPGNAQGNEIERFIANVWQNLLKPNADIAIDLHTQTSGTTYPLYVFADYRLPQSKAMAKQMNPDVILNDPGDKGVLESTWNEHGIASITVEVGAGRLIDPVLVERSVEGVLNILRANGVISGTEAAQSKCLEGSDIISIRAKQGGFVTAHVKLMETVEAGQLVATQVDSFGDVVERYYAPQAATVLSYCVEALRAPGSLVVRLIV